MSSNPNSDKDDDSEHRDWTPGHRLDKRLDEARCMDPEKVKECGEREDVRYTLECRINEDIEHKLRIHEEYEYYIQDFFVEDEEDSEYEDGDETNVKKAPMQLSMTFM